MSTSPLAVCLAVMAEKWVQVWRYSAATWGRRFGGDLRKKRPVPGAGNLVSGRPKNQFSGPDFGGEELGYPRFAAPGTGPARLWIPE